MSKKHDKLVEKQLIDIVNSRGNDNKCGECGTTYPTWASWNLGVLLCGRCASIHRRLLKTNNISRVKSLTLDHWNSEQVESLRRIGNKKAKRKWNSKRVPFPFDDDDDGPIEDYIRDKYLLGKFRDDSLDANDFDDRYSDSRASSPYNRLRLNLTATGRSRSGSKAIPSLTHRKLTTFEQSQYQSQRRQMLNFGYSDADAVLESLLLSNGSVDGALDILEQDARINPAKTEMPPELPKRPSTTASSVISQNNPMKSLIDAPSSSLQGALQGDWWSGTNGSTPSVTTNATGAPQIYQYTDPVTGQVSYVDANGQQYLDPNNPQHQQMLYQQTNPQLVAQQTNKQNIMSLYNQPDRFASNVAVPVDQLLQNLQVHQPFSQPPLQQILPFGQQPQQVLPFGQATGQQQVFGQATGQQQVYGQQQQAPQQTGYFSGMGQPQQSGYNQFGQPQQGYWR